MRLRSARARFPATGTLFTTGEIPSHAFMTMILRHRRSGSQRSMTTPRRRARRPYCARRSSRSPTGVRHRRRSRGRASACRRRPLPRHRHGTPSARGRGGPHPVSGPVLMRLLGLASVGQRTRPASSRRGLKVAGSGCNRTSILRCGDERLPWTGTRRHSGTPGAGGC